MKKKIIFLHLPKNAGSTLKSILKREYSETETFQLKHSVSGIWNMPEFISMPKSERESINLLSGHLDYGAHTYFDEDVRYITMLRHPIERTVSFYNYVKRQKNHRLLDECKDKTLLECIKNVRDFDVVNGQARKISGISDENVMLDVALKNLEKHFDFVGIQERFDESLILLRKEMGWNKIYYKSVNVAKTKFITYDENIVDAIMETNKVDIELYNAVMQQFQENIDKIKMFNLKLNAYQIANKSAPVRQLLNQLM